eukprot:12702162-Heterocapsa_arctica.AAC.1
MTRLVWSSTSVKQKIAELPSHKARKKARRAWKYLMSADDSSYATIYKQHTKFLAKHASPGGGTDDGGEDEEEEEEEADEISVEKRRLPLRFIETVGVECAVWPHLYWRTDMCETAVRSRDVR